MSRQVDGLFDNPSLTSLLLVARQQCLDSTLQICSISRCFDPCSPLSDQHRWWSDPNTFYWSQGRSYTGDWTCGRTQMCCQLDFSVPDCRRLLLSTHSIQLAAVIELWLLFQVDSRCSNLKLACTFSASIIVCSGFWILLITPPPIILVQLHRDAVVNVVYETMPQPQDHKWAPCWIENCWNCLLLIDADVSLSGGNLSSFTCFETWSSRFDGAAKTIQKCDAADHAGPTF